MNNAMPVQQRGLSFGGFIFGAFLLVIVSISLLKLIPAYIQNAQINSVFNEIVHDPSMDKASPREIRNAFDKRASIDDITAIKSDEIEIASDGGRLDLSASYSVKVPLFGNVSVLLEFNPSSDR
ncbi:MAG: DUF4845 domain-containing protein [Pseudomonadota bacterium]